MTSVSPFVALAVWAVLFGGAGCKPAGEVQRGAVPPNDLEAILQRRTLRCGYVSNPPSCLIDPNTRKVTGISVEVMEAIAAAASLKVEWVEEVGFGSMIEGLQANRYDAVPCGIWPSTARATQADFTAPMFYSGVGAYVRSNDARFHDDLSQVNVGGVRIATMDGEMAEAIAASDFPKAQRVQSPQLSEISLMLLNVRENKADVALVETYQASKFLEANPGSLINLAEQHPIRIFPNTILIRRGQAPLKAFLNTALDELVNLGAMDRVLDLHEPRPKTFYRLKRAGER